MGGVPRSPVPHEMAAHRVGAPVSATHGLQWADSLAFIHAGVGQAIACCSFREVAASATHGYYLVGSISPGARVLRVAVQLQLTKGTTATATSLVNVQLSGVLAGAAWVTGMTAGLDGGTNLYTPFEQREHYTEHVGYLDVTECTKNVPGIISIAVTAGALASGLYNLTITEVPIATYAPEQDGADEISLNNAEFYAGSAILDGYSATAAPGGTYRLFDQMASARTGMRRHVQVVRAADTGVTGDWYVEGTTHADPFRASAVLKFRTRPQNLYATVDEPCRQWITYLCDTPSHDAELKTIVTPIGGSPTTTTYALPYRATWGTIDAGALALPVTGTNGEVEIKFTLKSAGAAPSRVYCAGLHIVSAPV